MNVAVWIEVGWAAELGKARRLDWCSSSGVEFGFRAYSCYSSMTVEGFNVDELEYSPFTLNGFSVLRFLK